jgi:lipid II:glycine glycyltransferase (peptidoglycan interpeptide bridge formation enzyme)
MADLRQSEEYAHYLKLIGWTVEKVGRNFIYIRRLPLLPFSVIKIQRPKPPLSLVKIDQLAKKYRAIIIYLEPSAISHQPSAISHQYHLHRSPFLPTKTVQIDLTQSEEKIMARMKKDAKYSLRKAKKKEIKILRYEDTKGIEKFYHDWKKAVGWRRHVPSLKNLQALKRAFGKNAIFLTGNARFPGFLRNGKLEIRNCLAGTAILIAGKTAYYFYAFTSKSGRRNFAQYLLVWEGIRLAKKRGCQVFDFEGIYDPRFPQKSWQGFSHFKKGFGGKEVEYPGCFRKYNFRF